MPFNSSIQKGVMIIRLHKPTWATSKTFHIVLWTVFSINVSFRLPKNVFVQYLYGIEYKGKSQYIKY